MKRCYGGNLWCLDDGVPKLERHRGINVSSIWSSLGDEIDRFRHSDGELRLFNSCFLFPEKVSIYVISFNCQLFQTQQLLLSRSSLYLCNALTTTF